MQTITFAIETKFEMTYEAWCKTFHFTKQSDEDNEVEKRLLWDALVGLADHNDEIGYSHIAETPEMKTHIAEVTEKLILAHIGRALTGT
jgi:hypothetical protein